MSKAVSALSPKYSAATTRKSKIRARSRPTPAARRTSRATPGPLRRDHVPGPRSALFDRKKTARPTPLKKFAQGVGCLPLFAQAFQPLLEDRAEAKHRFGKPLVMAALAEIFERHCAGVIASRPVIRAATSITPGKGVCISSAASMAGLAGRRHEFLNNGVIGIYCQQRRPDRW